MSSGAIETSSFPPVNSLKSIVAFINAIRTLFSMMVRVPATVSEPLVKGRACLAYNCSSVVGFSGEITGCVVLGLHTKTAEAITSSFAGIPIKANDPDFPDALGELANLIAGAAKGDLGYVPNISVPSVIIGAGHRIATLSDGPCVVIPRQTAVVDFAVEVCVKPIR